MFSSISVSYKTRWLENSKTFDLNSIVHRTTCEKHIIHYMGDIAVALLSITGYHFWTYIIHYYPGSSGSKLDAFDLVLTRSVLLRPPLVDTFSASLWNQWSSSIVRNLSSYRYVEIFQNRILQTSGELSYWSHVTPMLAGRLVEIYPMCGPLLQGIDLKFS